MATRKFKQDWTPTPLHAPIASVAAELAPIAEPVQEPIPGAATVSAATSAIAGAATSALTSARATVAHSALAGAATAALHSAQSSARSAATTALQSAQSSALGSMAGSALTSAGSALAHAESALASALGPFPSPVALINRASFIIKFFVKSLSGELFRAALGALGIKRQRTVKAAREARDFGERLGGMWIILFRLISLRGDLLGVAFCQELARTRDLSLPIPFEQIRQVVDADLHVVGTSFEETFVEFSEQPIAVRSFGQVHRARLRETNCEVVVRVRAPEAVKRAETDWRYLRILLFLLENLKIDPHLRWGDLMFEVKQSTDDLLDFRTEVEELRKIAKVLRKRKIYVPQVFRRLCTAQMLVLEYINGVSVDEVMRLNQANPDRCDDWLRENKIKLRRVWSRLFNAHHELLFEQNLFYTELHPGSIMLLKGNRLALVSLGTVGTLDADLQRKYRQVYRALLEADYSKTCDYYLTMGPALPYRDISTMKQSTLRVLRKWESSTHVKGRPYGEKSLGSAMSELARCASEQKLPTVWNLARLQLAEGLLNSSLEFFDPTQSSIKALKKYEISAQIRAIVNTTKGVKKRVDGAVDVAKLNMQLLENFEHDGDYLRRRLMGVQAKLSKVSQIVGRLVMMVAKLALVALLVQAYVYFRHGRSLPIALAEQGTLARVLNALQPQSRGSWLIVLGGLFLMRNFLTKLARQLFTKEVRPADVA